MKSKPTLNQRLARSVESASAATPEGQRGARATITSQNILWNLPNTGPVKFLRDIFGDNLVRTFAIAMNPLVVFQSNVKKIAPATRFRKRADFVTICGYNSTRVSTTDDYYEGESTHTEFRTPEMQKWSENFLDSTKKLRGPNIPMSEMRSGKATTKYPDYPALPFALVGSTIREGVGGYSTSYSETGSYPAGAARVALRGNWFNDQAVDSLEESLRQFCYENLEDFLTPCLASARSYNAFYQLGELKDLPKLVKGVLGSYEYAKKVWKDGTELQQLDKKVSDAYLNKLFGLDSLISTLKSVSKAPTRVAKRMNYLLSRNEKLSTQRYKIVITDPDRLAMLQPWYSVLIPSIGEYEILDEKLSWTPSLEIRCVVNAFVHFPQVAVPEFSDLKFQELIGTIPRVTDIYNLFPFTWLFDWYTGLGDYLNLVETVLLDPSLVNYGLVTCILKCEFSVSGTAIVSVRDVVSDEDGNEVSSALSSTLVVPYQHSAKMEYRTRFDISSLANVKTAVDKNGNLNDQQKTILGALISQFVK